MDGKIKKLIMSRRDYEAEWSFLHNHVQRMKCELDKTLMDRLNFVDEQLFIISTWFLILSEDEAYVLQRHLVDGLDMGRVKDEYNARWGDNYAKTERTMKNYQRRALQKIINFENRKEKLLESASMQKEVM